MSRVPYTVNVNEYVCSVLERLRDMDKYRDYSLLLKEVDTVQYHVNQMEEGLYAGHRVRSKLRDLLDADLTDEQKVAQVAKLLDEEEKSDG